jgi:hypothetical protein
MFGETEQSEYRRGIYSKSGSHNEGDNVPNVYRSNDGNVNVNWNKVDYSNPDYGVRREVSINNPAHNYVLDYFSSVFLSHPAAILDISTNCPAIRT